MKVYISADIEGVCDVTSWDETSNNSRAAEQMSKEVAAACDGAFEAGADQVLVKDAHGKASTILHDTLPRGVRLIRGWSAHPYKMMQGIDESFDAAMFIGYHAGPLRGDSPLEHIISEGRVDAIRLNGTVASEFLLNAFTAALEGVPSVFISGDAGVCVQARELLPQIGTTAVKEGHGDSTTSIHPRDAVAAIREGALTALREEPERCLPELPEQFDLQVRFKRHQHAFRASFYPGMERLDAHTVRLRDGDYRVVLAALLFVL